MALDEIVKLLDSLNEEELERLGAYLTVYKLRRNRRHQAELAKTLDDEDTRNWADEDEVVDQLAKGGSGVHRELLTFLIGLGENDSLRGDFVEKDAKGRDVEVAVVGKHAIYFHVEEDTDQVRVLRIVPAGARL